MDSVIGLIIVVVAAGLIALFVLARKQFPMGDLRVIPAIQQLRRAVGLAAEEGKRVHISLGRSTILSPSNASALAGLSTLERIAQQSRVSDRPPVATSGDGVLAILSQDTLQSVYRLGNSLEMYDADRGRMGGPTPFSYVAGILPVISGEQVSTNLLVGNFGPEIGLFCDMAWQKRSFSLAATDSLPAQAVLYASAQEPLIGEEAFALPAYMKPTPAHLASLRVQDMLRWALIGVLVIGVILKLIQLLLGITII